MLSLPTSVRVFVAAEPFDMRGSFDAVAGAVRRLELDPVDENLELHHIASGFVDTASRRVEWRPFEPMRGDSHSLSSEVP